MNWEHLVQAMFGAVISVAGLWIAVQQTRIARTQLNHEQYDRKFRAYGAVKGLLGAVQADGRVSRPAFQSYLEGIADAEFLFKPELISYLQDLRTRAARNIWIEERLSGSGIPQIERDHLADEAASDLKWFIDQFDEAAARFKGTMQL